MTIKERMTEYQGYRGMSDYAVEKALGKSKGYWHTCKNPTAGIIQLFVEKFPDISAEWLLRGTGPMIRDDESTNTLSNQYVSKAKNVTQSGAIHESTDSDTIKQLVEQNKMLLDMLQSQLKK